MRNRRRIVATADRSVLGVVWRFFGTGDRDTWADRNDRLGQHGIAYILDARE